ncbi:MAG: hypothetical protein MZV64_17050, partial [Ignavibacteriales bacterium]|nr:hypothetical protein [Ignavibacteriales bacterium]
YFVQLRIAKVRTRSTDNFLQHLLLHRCRTTAIPAIKILLYRDPGPGLEHPGRVLRPGLPGPRRLLRHRGLHLERAADAVRRESLDRPGRRGRRSRWLSRRRSATRASGCAATTSPSPPSPSARSSTPWPSTGSSSAARGDSPSPSDKDSLLAFQFHGTKFIYYYIALALHGRAVSWRAWRIQRSRIGYYLRAIREDAGRRAERGYPGDQVQADRHGDLGGLRIRRRNLLCRSTSSTWIPTACSRSPYRSWSAC